MAAAWPADQTERRALATLTGYARNSRTHSPAQIDQIAASIKEWGWTIPILVDESGLIIAGHARVEAAKKLGLTEVPVMVARGWSESKKRAYVIADNKLALNAGWDDEMLAIELAALAEDNFDLSLTGFDGTEIAQYLPGDIDGTGTGEAEERAADLLSRMDITIAEPRHVVEPGDRYVLDDRHILFCCGVIDAAHEWAQSIIDNEGSLFCPYPGPFVPFGKKAEEHTLIMVQPDVYIAGHLLDRYADAYGEDSIAKVE